MLVLFIIVGVIADVVLSYYISKKNATPINDMLNKMSIKTEDLEGHDTVISSIVNTVKDLVENNTDLIKCNQYAETISENSVCKPAFIF